MDKRQTVESIKAHQIFEEIKDLAHPFLKTFTIFEANTQGVARTLRLLVDTESITVTVKNTTIYAGTKQKRTPIQERVKELEKMVRRLALRTDDGRLYDEAMTMLRMEV